MPDPTPTTDLWNDRDLPLLRALVALSEQDPRSAPTAHTAGMNLSMNPDDIERALVRLRQGGMVSTHPTAPHRSGGGPLRVPLTLSRDALEVTGVWPTADTAADRLVEALKFLAEHAPTEPERTKARTAWQQIGTLSRDTLAAALATVLTGQLPGAGS